MLYRHLINSQVHFRTLSNYSWNGLSCSISCNTGQNWNEIILLIFGNTDIWEMSRILIVLVSNKRHLDIYNFFKILNILIINFKRSLNVVVLILFLRERKGLDSLQSNVSWMSGFCLGMSKTFMKCNNVNLS